MLEQKIQTRIGLRPILTPALQQAIKLLPMSTVELAEHLNQELVENPVLDEVQQEEVQQTDAAAQVEKSDPEPPAATEQQDTWDDSDYEYYFGEYLDSGYRPRATIENKEFRPFENTLSTTTSLSDYLRWQLCLRTDDEVLREVGIAIIGNLDDDGYLVASIDEIVAMGSWQTGDVERGLELVQQFDPVGIAARDVRECLLLQLKELELDGTPCETIVREHLQLLQTHQVPELSRRISVPVETLKEYIEILRRLDPKPGSRLNSTPSQYVVPDVTVSKVEGEYKAELNDDGMPRLRISPIYRRMIQKNSNNSDETRAYVKDKLKSAIWLIKSVDQRQKTIEKVAMSIIEMEREFLDHGIEHLRPLVLRDVAESIGMHESTVSRVVSNKYMHTPQGVFEMKYFFHSGVRNVYRQNISSVAIKQRIRNIIENEDTRKPLSDSRIVHRLQEVGLPLARRTIAKYREELRIPTASQRKVRY